ncbi:GyrI-like domain-containing protein [Clostridium malenominatum]|uniref:GyrI-like domain-containing protein n=1 Tax=Clostridium malenominatum TaxID=1539 RepID=A0ABP3U1I8_9CLOT
MKYEWRKQDKNIYLPKNNPELIEIPSMNFFMLEGKGNPNDDAFSEAVGVIYSLSYAIKMMPKKGIVPEGYFDYTIFPLEGVWDLEEEARGEEILNKDKLIYTLMIRQPSFVTKELAETAINITKKNKPHHLLENVKFESCGDGLSVQMMHIGKYDEEPASFDFMEKYCNTNNLIRKEKTHREIYISDFRKTDPEKLKTVLRFKVERKLNSI